MIDHPLCIEGVPTHTSEVLGSLNSMAKMVGGGGLLPYSDTVSRAVIGSGYWLQGSLAGHTPNREGKGVW